MAGSSVSPDTGLPVYSLFVGSKNGDAWRSSERDAVFAEASRLFDSFTMTEATGSFRGRCVPTLVIRLGTNEEQTVHELARILGRLTGQEEIGLEWMGRFHSIKV